MVEDIGEVEGEGGLDASSSEEEPEKRAARKLMGLEAPSDIGGASGSELMFSLSVDAVA